MAKEDQFNTFWGDLSVGKVEDAPADDTTKKKDEVDEDVLKNKVKAEEPDDKVDIDKKDAKEEVDAEDEYEYTEDDVSKAFTMLEEAGILEIGDEDEFDITPDGLADTVAVTIRKGIQKGFDEIPSVVNDYYRHVQGGGDPAQFVPTNSETDWTEFDLDSETNQEFALRAMHKANGLSDEDIDEEIEDAKATNKLAKKASVATGVLTKKQEATAATRAESQRNADAAAAQKAQDDIEALKSKIDSTEEIANFALDTDKKENFKKYLFDINKRTGKTQMQENMVSEERRLRIAFMDFMDYNKEDISKGIATDLTKKRRKKLTKFRDTNVKNKNSSATVKSSSTKNSGRLVIPSIFSGNDEVED